MKLTAEADSTFYLVGAFAKENRKGETATMRDGQLVSVVDSPEDAKAFADCDNWVNQRVNARDAAQAAMMKEANLAAAVPGLADMQGQGKFFSCAPYGTCWEPTKGWSGTEGAAPDGPDTDTAQALPGRSGDRSAGRLLQVAQVSGSDPAGVERSILDEDLFPCSPQRVRRLITTDPATGRRQTSDLEGVPEGGPYSWSVCHSGSWIRRQHRYAWVAGTKRHHLCPVHWVKSGQVRGFVPIHPRDVAGRPPLNLQHGVFVPIEKQHGTLERVAFNPGTSLKLLGGPPKEFAQLERPALERADEPRLEAHLSKDGIGKGGGLHPGGTPITFDHKSQSFLLAHSVTQGGKTVTIAEHFGGGSTGGHAGNGGFAHSGGGSFGRSGGGGSGGSSHGGGSGGGGGGHASSVGSSGGGGSSSGGSGASGGAHK
jgi:hypothetical protein